ncbi:holliday junction resolvase [Mycolicibacterium phage Kashi_SSH1]|nr:holliday junction resolvase [Mycolicibacterium phage Kashi_SSH1]
MFMSKCAQCGSEFEQKNKYRETKTCSRKCRYALSAQSNRQTQGAQYLGRECPQCGKSFDGKTTHCSRECSNKARSGDKHPAVIKAQAGRSKPCKVCGEPTQHTQRETCPEHRRGWQKREVATCPCGQPAENIRSKYCGEACRKKWGVKTPVRMITRTCLACGNEFERPHYFPGKLKYCSNACSHRQVKKVRDKFIADLPEGAVVFHSMWEVRFVAACERFDIPWRSYDGPDIETSEGIYRPDFIIGKPGEERVVDVKGWLRPESEVKCREAGVHLVTKQELLRLESGDSLDAHRMLVWNSGMNAHTGLL